MAIKKTKALERLISKLEDVKLELHGVISDRQDKFDSRSEKWQEGEKGQEESENLFALEDIHESLDLAFEKLDSLCEE
jgi:hypothetical protein